MAYHFQVPGFVGGGHTGVAIFFCMSGFLITTLLLEERLSGSVSLRNFYWRRARRLLPALAALVAIVALVALLRGNISEVGGQALAVLLYAGNWAQYHQGMSLEHLSHTWSLGVEEQFYLVWPLLLVGAYAAARLRGVFLAAIVLFIGTVAVRFSGIYLAELERAVDTLMIGCALAVIAVAGRLQVPHWIGYAAVPALGGLAMFTDYFEVRPWQPVVVGIASAALIADLLMRPSRLSRMLSARPLVFTGKISYALYLWHFAIGWEVWPALYAAGWHWLPAAAALTVLSYVAAFASYRYIEAPLLARRSRRREQEDAGAQPAGKSAVEGPLPLYSET